MSFQATAFQSTAFQVTEDNGDLPMIKPTPTQAELDAAMLGQHISPKEMNGSALDVASMPPGSPPPNVPKKPR
jgi:hypothetical protein